MNYEGEVASKKSSVPQEENRLKALYDYEILDTKPQKEYNELTSLAATICDAPVARINLIDTNRQWSKAVFGTDPDDIEIPRNTSVCQFTIHKKEILEINDLNEDQRFSDMPYVKGKPYYRYYLGAPLTTPEGYSIGALCVLDFKPREMGDRQKKQLEILADEVIARFELQKKNRELEKLNEHKVNLMKMLSHDMRSPINGIIGMSSILAGELENDSHLEMVELLEQSAVQLNQMIDEIMSYSLIESKGFELNAEPVDLKDIVDSMKRLYIPVAQSKDIDLSFGKEVNEPVRIDKNKFEQIMGNLLSNALKFTKKGGKVSCLLDVSYGNDQKNLVLKVSDNGVGMEQETVENLFKSGEINGKSGTSGEKSTGLGLSIIKYFVNLHSGEINVSSESGKDTVFKVSIPLNNN